MNKIIKSLTAALVGSAVVASSAFAAFPNPDGAKPDAESWQAPQPAEIVAPLFSRVHDGSTVRIKLTIDEQGTPSDVIVLFPHDPQLKRNIVEAVEQWTFEPARKNGEAVEVRVVMPLELKVDYNS